MPKFCYSILNRGREDGLGARETKEVGIEANRGRRVCFGGQYTRKVKSISSFPELEEGCHPEEEEIEREINEIVEAIEKQQYLREKKANILRGKSGDGGGGGKQLSSSIIFQASSLSSSSSSSWW